MLGALTLPSRLVVRFLDDVHTIAGAVGSLEATEEELSRRMDALNGEVQSLRDWLQPLLSEVAELGDGVEKLDAALAALCGHLETVGGSVEGFRADLDSLRDRIPGL